MRAWAHLEFTLMFYLQTLIASDQWRARAVWLSLPNFRSRLNLISRLVETFIEDEATLAGFQSITKRLTALSRNRNTLAHSIGGNLDTHKRHVFIVDGGDQQGPMKFSEMKPLQLKTIAGWHDQMQALRKEMGEFLGDAIAPNMLASPRKRP